MLKATSSVPAASRVVGKSALKVVCYSVIPSPYQRDLFGKLASLAEIDLSVFYWESSVSDSPWPEEALQSYEQVMPGHCLIWGDSRFFLNWHWPRFRQADVVILNGYMNSVVQLILHTQAKTLPCIFWGEKIVAESGGIKGQIQKVFVKGLDNCSTMVAIGSKAEQDYHQLFPNKPVFNIPYHCDLASFSQQRPDRPREPVTILFCGQMILRKGVDLLLQAFQRLLEQGYIAKLLLVGREAELPQMLEDLPEQVQQQIEFAGFQAPEDLPHFFHRADIFVLPSRYDGWGVVVNQALGAGLPIICSDAVGAAQDLIEPGVNGFTFPAGDTEALFTKLEYFFQQPDRIRTASHASAEKASHWSVDAGAKRWLQVIKTATTA